MAPSNPAHTDIDPVTAEGSPITAQFSRCRSTNTDFAVTAPFHTGSRQLRRTARSKAQPSKIADAAIDYYASAGS